MGSKDNRQAVCGAGRRGADNRWTRASRSGGPRARNNAPKSEIVTDFPSLGLL